METPPSADKVGSSDLRARLWPRCEPHSGPYAATAVFQLFQSIQKHCKPTTLSHPSPARLIVSAGVSRAAGAVVPVHVDAALAAPAAVAAAAATLKNIVGKDVSHSGQNTPDDRGRFPLPRPAHSSSSLMMAMHLPTALPSSDHQPCDPSATCYKSSDAGNR